MMNEKEEKEYRKKLKKEYKERMEKADRNKLYELIYDLGVKLKNLSDMLSNFKHEINKFESKNKIEIREDK